MRAASVTDCVPSSSKPGRGRSIITERVFTGVPSAAIREGEDGTANFGFVNFVGVLAAACSLAAADAASSMICSSFSL